MHWRRWIGSQRHPKRVVGYATPIEATGGQMTGKRIYWLLGTIVTFGTTIYDDWNSGQFSRYTFAQRCRTTKVPNETPYQTGSISRSSVKKDSAVVSACNELPDRNNPPVLHLRPCKTRFSSRWNDAVPSRFYLDSLDGIQLPEE